MKYAFSNTRCVDGRTMRHDPQHDDPDLETDIGRCPECEGRGCGDIHLAEAETNNVDGLIAQVEDERILNPLNHYKTYLIAQAAAESFVLAYARAESGDRSYSYSLNKGIDDVRKLAAQLGFQLVPIEAAISGAP